MTRLSYACPVWRAIASLLLFFAAPPLQELAIQAAGSTLEIEPGIVYTHDIIRSVPWSIHLLQIERSRPELEFITTIAQNRVLGLSTVSDQVRSIPAARGRPIAAVSGDFFRTEHEPYAGDPHGLEILLGELVSAPEGKAAFWIDPSGEPHITNVISQLRVIWPSGDSTPIGLNEERPSHGAVLYTPRLGPSTGTRGGREFILDRVGRHSWLPLRPGVAYMARVRDVREKGNTELDDNILVLSLGPSLASRCPKLGPEAVLTISTETIPDLHGVRTAIGGGPILLHDRKRIRAFEHQPNQRHPRSAVGWNSKYVFLMVVDGRQPGLSVGMTLAEVADYLLSHGCDEAMNLDGGGSAELWLNGSVANSPCYGYERHTANTLVLMRKPVSR